MKTKDEFLFSKQNSLKNDSSHTADNINQDFNLHLNQTSKCSLLNPIQFCSKSYNNKYCVPDKCNESEKPQSLNKSSTIDRHSKILAEDKFRNKKNVSSNSATNSNLSLHINAFENSFEVATYDSFDNENNQSSKKEEHWSIKKQQQNTGEIFPDASTLFIQNPFEFPRQQNIKESEPETAQFRVSQRLLKTKKSTFNTKTPEFSKQIENYKKNLAIVQKSSAPQLVKSTNMSSWWDYFDKYMGTTIAMCRHCTYSKDLGPSRSTGCLANHLKNHHPTQYLQKMTLSSAVKEQSAIKMEWSRKRQNETVKPNFDIMMQPILPITPTSPIEPPTKIAKYSPKLNSATSTPKTPSIRILQPIVEIKESSPTEIDPAESTSPDIIPLSPPVVEEITESSSFINPMSHIMHKVQDALEAVESKVADVLHGHHHDNSTDDSSDAVSPLHSHSNKNRGRLARKMTIEEERGNEYFL